MCQLRPGLAWAKLTAIVKNMSWLLLTALSVVSRAVYGVMTKVLSDKVIVSAPTQAVLLTTAGAAFAVLASPFLGGVHLTGVEIDWIVVLLVVLGQGLGNVVYFASIKHLTNGTAQIAFSSILVFNTFLSLVFLSLQLSFINILGIILLLLAILAVVSGTVEFNKRGVGLMLLAAFLFSVFQVASVELSQQVTAATYLVIAYGGSALVVFVLKARQVISDVINTQALKTLLLVPVLTAIPSVGNFLFSYYAYRLAPEPAKVAILLTSQVVVAVFLSYFLLKEKSHLGRKLGAAAAIIIASLLIKD